MYESPVKQQMAAIQPRAAYADISKEAVPDTLVAKLDTAGRALSDIRVVLGNLLQSIRGSTPEKSIGPQSPRESSLLSLADYLVSDLRDTECMVTELRDRIG